MPWCTVCKEAIKGASRSERCWGCPAQAHLKCMSLGDRVYAGPWYCLDCQQRLQAVRDVTLDSELLAFVISRIEHSEERSKNRVHRAAAFLHWDAGKLLIRRGDQWVEVPPIRDRKAIVSSTAAALAFASGERVYEVLHS